MTGLHDEAPGWDAIEAAVAALFREQTPLHWGTNALPGQDGIYGLSAYRGEGIWFLVTFGLSELFEKESDDPEVSGWGLELTMRVPMGDAAAPPTWALNLLNKLGRYVFSAGTPFAPGHRMDPGGPITGADDTRLTALAFAPDPQLPRLWTPNGGLDFLAVVGITAEELEEMKSSSTSAVLEQIATASPLLVTDPER